MERFDRIEFTLLPSEELSETVVAEILELLRSAFPNWPRFDPGVPQLDHLRWKMSSPNAPYCAWYGRLDGRLVVMCVLQQFRARVRGVVRSRGQITDYAVHPDYQSQGLTEFVNALPPTLTWRYDLHFSEAGHRWLFRIGREWGRRVMGNRVRSLYRVLDAARFAEAWVAAPAGTSSAARVRLAKVPRTLLPVGLAALRLWSELRGRGPRTAPNGATLQTVTRFDDRFDRFFERAAAPFELIAERGAEFLSWRYGDRRAGPFVVRSLERDGELLGYLALRATAKHAHIADLLALPDELAVIETLVGDAVALSRQAGAGGIACWLPERHPYRPALRRLGFVDRIRDVGLQYRSSTLPDEELAFLAAPSTPIHVTLGDTDQV